MNVAVDAPRREDLPFASNGLRSWSHHDRHPLLGVGVAGFSDGHDAAVPQAHIGFDDAPPIQD